MKVLAILSVCLLVSVCHGASQTRGGIGGFRGSRPPEFCRDLACPTFIALKRLLGYDYREYGPSLWVSTNSAGVDFTEAFRTNFMRLSEYISGKNSAGKKINMTTPVITKIIPGPESRPESNFTMSFYVALGNPPTPTDPKVYLEPWSSPFRAYVSAFGGYLKGLEPWLKEAEKLRADIEKASSGPYNTDYYYIAVYDGPYKLYNRHNEIWFMT